MTTLVEVRFIDTTEVIPVAIGQKAIEIQQFLRKEAKQNAARSKAVTRFIRSDKGKSLIAEGMTRFTPPVVGDPDEPYDYRAFKQEGSVFDGRGYDAGY